MAFGDYGDMTEHQCNACGEKDKALNMWKVDLDTKRAGTIWFCERCVWDIRDQTRSLGDN